MQVGSFLPFTVYRLGMLLGRSLEIIRRARARLGLNLATLLIASAGLVAIAGSVAVFGAATEDVTEHNGMATHDAARLRIFTAHRSETLVHLSKIATGLGAPLILGALAVVVGALFWRRGLHLALALTPAFALGISAAAVGLVKAIVGRARPPVSLHLVSESDASFPSGHATDGTALFIAIALVVALFVVRRPALRIASLAAGALLSGAIGASRLILGVHWPSDVLAGLALGLCVSVAVTMAAMAVTRLTPPPVDQPTRARRSAARALHVLSRRRGLTQDLRAA